MFTPRQTITELYWQLSSLGYDADALSQIGKAYTLSTHLFNGAYRGSGKPFVCHLVGTASVTAWLGLGINATTASLLHSAFTHGFFKDGSMGFTSNNIRTVTSHTCKEVVELVTGYSNCGLKTHDIDEIAKICGTLSESQRTIYLMRLANELDELYDLSLFATGKRGELGIERLNKCAMLAESLGQKELAGEFLGHLENHANGMLPPISPPSVKSYHLIPGLAAWWRIRKKKNVYPS